MPLKARELLKSLEIDERNFKVIEAGITNSCFVLTTIIKVSSVSMSEMSCCLYTEVAYLLEI